MVARLTSLMLLVGVAGCAVDEVDLEGKRCPCPDGWVCAAGTCARRPAACGSEGRYVIEALEAGWSAEHQLQLTWSVADSSAGEDLAHLAVVIGTDPESVEECGCALAEGGDCAGLRVRVIDEDENPELGNDTRSNQTDGTEPVRETTIAGLMPDTLYRAQLLAFDIAGGVSRSASISPRTSRETAFDAPFFEGVSRTGASAFPSCPMESGESLDFIVQCPPPIGMRGECGGSPDPCNADTWACDDSDARPRLPQCWWTFRWSFDPAEPLPAITEGQFQDAYLEIEVGFAGTSNYGELYLRTEDPATGETLWWGRRGDFAIRGGGAARVYQIPLTALTHEEGRALSADEWRGLAFSELRFGGIFPDRSPVTARAIRFRY
ncbi:MAG: hypothetical protein EVA89_37730 [Sandaracinaceae bacterium]|nr:MAG: hypothetical protein EVA89_37730 [Sandaracinaceae bacterium]